MPISIEKARGERHGVRAGDAMIRVTIGKRAARAALALAVVTLVSGCTGGSADEGEPPTGAAPVSDSALPESPIIETFVACLQERGWDAKRDGSGMPVVDNVPEGQANLQAQDADECGDSSGWNTMGQRSTMSDAQLGALYDQEVEEQQCVAALGYDTETPPSRQTYIDTYGTENQYYGWRPGLEGLDQAAFNKAVLACPPPTWFMNIPGL